MKTLNLLTIIFLVLGAVLAFTPSATTKHSKVEPTKVLEEIQSRSHLISADETAKLIISEEPDIQLVDVRNPDEFLKYSLPGAVNIPLGEILEEKWSEIFESPKTKILFSNSSADATQAWMLLRQSGTQDILVLEGGLNYWFESIMNPQKPSTSSPDDEIARYNFRKAASGYFGGGDSTAMKAVKAQPVQSSKPAGATPATGGKKKKGASGGCS